MTTYNENAGGGVLTKLKKLLEQNRLGELLVIKGLLTPQELEQALVHQEDSKQQLGRVLVERNIVKRRHIYRVLAEQWTLRGIAAMATVFITFSSLSIKTARAGTVKDIPAQIKLADTANAAFTPVAYYPALFGSSEKRSDNITPFTKWTSMFDRFEADMNDSKNQHVIRKWQAELQTIKGGSIKEMAQKVNTMANRMDYIIDQRNWDKSDYWETPVEFFARGGDCEDFAIAKYASLRALGVPEERMRVAIVHDMVKDIPHAVLIVYTDTQALILDNQSENVLSSSQVSRYRPIFTINRTAWWLHTPRDKTILASVD